MEGKTKLNLQEMEFAGKRDCEFWGLFLQFPLLFLQI